MSTSIRKGRPPAFRKSARAVLLSATACWPAAPPTKPPADQLRRRACRRCRPCPRRHRRPAEAAAYPARLDVARGGTAAGTPTGRVENANAAARVQPRREGYYNAIQIYPWSEGALYQVYAAPGQITDIALEPGESLTGAGPIAAGDTARWIIGDTEADRASPAASMCS
jgi:hypothetical protein